MNVNLKMFCILFIYMAMRHKSVKPQKICLLFLKLSLILSSVFVVIIICCLAAMKIKDCRTNYIRYISNCDAEVDLNDNAVGRSRHERFYSVRSTNNATENLSLRRRPRELNRVGCVLGYCACEVEATNSRHISTENIPKSSKIPDYTRRAHVLRDVSNAFRERTCKHESKRKIYESSESILRFERPTRERVPKVIGRTGVFRDRGKLGRTPVCSEM